MTNHNYPSINTSYRVDGKDPVALVEYLQIQAHLYEMPNDQIAEVEGRFAPGILSQRRLLEKEDHFRECLEQSIYTLANDGLSRQGVIGKLGLDEVIFNEFFSKIYEFAVASLEQQLSARAIDIALDDNDENAARSQDMLKYLLTNRFGWKPQQSQGASVNVNVDTSVVNNVGAGVETLDVAKLSDEKLLELQNLLADNAIDVDFEEIPS